MTHCIKSILLVDDDQDYKYFFYKALEQVNPEITVTNAGDGREAFDKLEEFIPDMIILDFNMPRMNGMAFLKEIKKDEKLKQIPVILYSTYMSMFDSEEIKELGAVHVFTKPVGFDATVSTLAEILNIKEVKNCA